MDEIYTVEPDTLQVVSVSDLVELIAAALPAAELQLDGEGAEQSEGGSSSGASSGGGSGSGSGGGSSSGSGSGYGLSSDGELYMTGPWMMNPDTGYLMGRLYRNSLQVDELIAQSAPHPALTTDFSEYTVTEALLLLLLLLGVIKMCIRMIKGGFSWLTW